MLKQIIDKIKHQSEAVELYTLCLVKVIHDKDFIQKYENRISCLYGYWELYDEDNHIKLNKIMHILHTQYPECREEAVRMLNEEVYKNFNETEILFTGESCYFQQFPEELKEQIEKTLEHIRSDIAIIYTSTWQHSHLEYGDGYIYKENETPKLIITAINDNTKEKAVNKLAEVFEENIIIKEG